MHRPELLAALLGLLLAGAGCGLGGASTICRPPTVYVRAQLVTRPAVGRAQLRLVGSPVRGRIKASDSVFQTGPLRRVIAVRAPTLPADSPLNRVRAWALDRRLRDSTLVLCSILPSPGVQRDQRSTGNSSDPCSGRICPFGATCSAQGGRARCRCPEVCAAVYRPVCGTDDRSYPNDCALQRAACRSRRLLSVRYPGRCRPCAGVHCRYYSECVRGADGRHRCVCPQRCSRSHGWTVCGSDGVNYSDECRLRATACSQQRHIEVKSFSRCPQGDQTAPRGPPPAVSRGRCRVEGGRTDCPCPRSCPESSGASAGPAVCASDSRTYASQCHLRRAACRGPSLRAVHVGPCDNAVPCQARGLDCPRYAVCQNSTGSWRCQCPSCGLDSDLRGPPICSADGRTRASECHFRAEMCRSGQVMRIQHLGECGICQKMQCQFYSICHINRFGRAECVCPSVCPAVYTPICGSDGRTYSNVCAMKTKACSVKKNITVIAQEACRSCPSGCPIGTFCVHGECQCRDRCPGLRMTVCGSDGRFYRNECELKRSACLSRTSINIDPSGDACPSSDAPSGEKRKKKLLSKRFPKQEIPKKRPQPTSPTSGSNMGISLKQKSFILSSPLPSFRRYHSLDLTIIPQSLNGSIIFLGRIKSRSVADSMSIELVDGHVIYRFNLGSGDLVLKSKERLKPGRLHRIRVTRKGRWGKLTVDNESWTGRSPGHLRGFRFRFDHKLVIGYLAHSDLNSFVGCIQTVRLIAHRSGRNKDLINGFIQRGLNSEGISGIENGCKLHVCSPEPCLHEGVCRTMNNSVFQCTCPQKWTGPRCEKQKRSSRFKTPSFDGTGYIIIPPSTHGLKQRKFILEIWFLTTSLNGLVSQLARHSGTKSHFLQIQLINGWLQVSCRSGNGLVIMRSESRMPRREWIQLQVRKSRHYVSMRINKSQRSRIKLVPNYFRNLKKSERRKVTEFRAYKEPLFIGGFPPNEIQGFQSSQDVSFKGAIQRVMINRKRIDLYSKMVKRSTSLTEWRGPPCINRCGFGRECEPQLNKAKCVCVNPPCSEPLLHDQPIPPVSYFKPANRTRQAINFNGYTLIKMLNRGKKRKRRSRRNNFEIKLKTIARNGMIMLSTEKNMRGLKSSFYFLALRDGYPEIVFNVGGTNGLIRIRGRNRINDNRWHTLHAVRTDSLTTLLVDGVPFTGSMISTKVVIITDGWLWIGGVLSPIQEFPWEYNRGFMGCLKDLFIDSESVDLWRLGTAQRGEVSACSLPYEF